MKPRTIQIDKVIEYNSEGGSFVVKDVKLYFSLNNEQQINHISVMLNGQLVDLQLTTEEILYIEQQLKACRLTTC